MNNIKENEAFPTAFVQFTKQLRNMREWFYHYGKKKYKDNPFHSIYEIDCHLRDALYEISNLVAYEYRERCFYAGRGKRKPKVKHSKSAKP